VTDRAPRIGSLVMSRETAQGLDAGDVGTVEAVRRQRTVAGTTVVVTLRIGQRQIEVQNPAAMLQPARIEAYGVKGLQSRSWRRTFTSAEQLTAWCERHDAAVLGQRYVEAA
jgi:hypothetical protein